MSWKCSAISGILPGIVLNISRLGVLQKRVNRDINRVIMDIILNQDSVAGFAPGTNAPIINTTQIETQVLVNNGETVVLGGIFQTEDIQGVTKTPFLGDIPYLGRLFRQNTSRQVKTEILIFITCNFCY